MKSLRLIYLFVPLSFAIGFYYGTLPVPKTSSAVLKVLTLKDVIPQQVISDYEARSSTRFLIEEVGSETEIIDQINEKTYDLVLLPNRYIDQISLKLWEIPGAPFSEIRGEFYQDRTRSIPLQWGINGFLFPKKSLSNPSSLKELFDKKKNIQLFSDAEELYRVLRRTGKISKDTNIAENVHLLKPILKELTEFVQLKRFREPSQRPDPKLIVQMESGKAAQKVDSEDWGFFIPEERATFWVRSWVIPEASQQKQKALKFAKYLSTAKVSQKMVEKTWTASTSSQIEKLPVHPMLKPSWLRKVSLKQIEKPEPMGPEKNVFMYLIESVGLKL